VNALARALLDELDDDAVRALAERLRPHLQPSDDGPLDAGAAARLAGVSPKTIRRALDAGQLDGQKVAGRWQTTRGAVEDWRARGGRTSGRVALAGHRASRPSRSTVASAIRGERP